MNCALYCLQAFLEYMLNDFVVVVVFLFNFCIDKSQDCFNALTTKLKYRDES